MDSINDHLRSSAAEPSNLLGNPENTFQTYLVLSTDELNLILPQNTISKVQHLNREYINEIQATHHLLDQNSSLDGKTSWFAALSDQFTLLAEIPKDRFLLTAFTDYPDVLWCWRDLYQISSEQIKHFPIPPIVTTPNTPVRALALLSNNKHAFFTSPRDICRFVLRGNMS